MRLTDYDRFLLILILRSVKLSQEFTCGALGCRKATITEAETWIRTCDISEAVVAITDEKIGVIIKNNIPKLIFKKSDVEKVSRVTADQIFLQYGRLMEWQKWVGIGKSSQGQSSLIKTEFQTRWSTHHEHLLVMLNKLGVQMDLSGLHGYLVDPSMSRLARENAGSESALLMDPSLHEYLTHFTAIRLTSTPHKAQPVLRLEIEEDPLFPALCTHLAAESLNIEQFVSWKEELLSAIATALDLAGQDGQTSPDNAQPVGKTLKEQLASLQKRATEWQASFILIKERGYLHGKCALCEAYYS